jgi:hypothetical protein
MQITKDGVYQVSMERYHNDVTLFDGPSVSSSGLRTISNRSLAHYWAESPLNPERLEDDEEESAAFILGRAAHHLLLGEDAFSTLFVARPAEIEGSAWQGNRTACKNWLADMANAGRTVLLPAQIKNIRGMAKTLSKHPLIKANILSGMIERTLVHKDKETGIWLKARPDAIPTDSGDYADLKTTPSVDFLELQKTVAKYGYHQQGALVGEVHQEVFKRPMTSFSLVFVESKAPWCVRVCTLRDVDLARGRAQNRTALRQLKQALETGDFPGPGDYNEADFLDLPDWKRSRIDTDLAYWRAMAEKPKAAE